MISKDSTSVSKKTNKQQFISLLNRLERVVHDFDQDVYWGQCLDIAKHDLCNHGIVVDEKFISVYDQSCGQGDFSNLIARIKR